jgi:CDP-diglyceride synthetase
MNSLVLRSISGLVYILLFLGAIYVPRKEVFFMWCALLGIGAALEIRSMFRLPRQLVFVGSSVILLLAYTSESKTIFIYAGVIGCSNPKVLA